MLRLTSFVALSALSLVGAAMAQAPSYPDGVSKQFSEWGVTCDTDHTCWAQAFAADYQMASLTLKREAGADAAPTIIITGPLADPVFDIPGFETVLAGAEETAVGEDLGPRLVIAADKTAGFIDALRNAASLTAADGTTISLSGASAAMRFIDDVQGRADTVTALVAKGSKPASAVPPAPVLPVISAPNTKAVLITDEPGTDLKAAGIEACGGDDEPEFEAIGSRLPDGREIWLMPCSNGAYNYIYAGLIKDGDVISDLTFTGLEAGGVGGDDGLWNPEISALDKDEVSGPALPLTITTFGRGRGIGDCGSITHFVWTGQAFALTSNTVMDHCAGVPFDDWPVRFSAEVKAQ